MADVPEEADNRVERGGMMRRRGRPSNFDERRSYLLPVAQKRIEYRKLPSVRKLAHKLGVSPRTIEADLTRLVSELLRDDRSNETSQVTTMV